MQEINERFILLRKKLNMSQEEIGNVIGTKRSGVSNIENGIRNVIGLSKLPITNWVATKEYNEQNRPYLHMYVELEREALLNTAMSANILKDLLSTYFKYIDQDYRDLKKILGMDPLQVTIFTCGTFETYEKQTGKKLHQMNPSYYDLKALLEVQECLNKVR